MTVSTGPMSPAGSAESASAALRRSADRIAAARRRLIAHIAPRISGDGVVRDTCASRVLESALMLTLLREARLHPDRQLALTRYLHGCSAAPGSFERILVDITVDGKTAPKPQEALAWLEDFDHPTAARKRVLFGTVLAVLGAVPFDPDLDPHSIRYTGHAPWVELLLCAVKLFHLGARGHEGPGELAFLEDRLRSGSDKPVWEGHALAHLLALLALQRHDPRHGLVRDGVAGLLGAQNPDGGMPFVDGFEVFCTATAGLALVTATGQPTATVIAMAGYLAAHQGHDGGWAYAEGVRQSDVDTTAYCLQLLTATAPQCYAAQIKAGEEYLTGIVNPDGGLPTFCRGHPSEIAVTAGALTALTPHWDSHPEIARAALAYLLAAQRPDGSFERNWSLSESNAIFRAVEALYRAGPRQPPRVRLQIDRSITLAAGHLTVTQHMDGGWGQRPFEPSDPISTSYALLAAGHWRPTPLRHAGLDYLLGQQRSDGGFTSPPDQAAPRPIAYDVPILADICALWAMRPQGA